MLGCTSANRGQLLRAFSSLAGENGVDLIGLLEFPSTAAQAHWHFLETINLVAFRKSTLRRQLGLLVDGHGAAHAPRGNASGVEGVLLRIGEAVFATRDCLILPRDTCGSQPFILLRIFQSCSPSDGQAGATRPRRHGRHGIRLIVGPLPSLAFLAPDAAAEARQRLGQIGCAYGNFPWTSGLFGLEGQRTSGRVMECICKKWQPSLVSLRCRPPPRRE